MKVGESITFVPGIWSAAGKTSYQLCADVIVKEEVTRPATWRDGVRRLWMDRPWWTSRREWLRWRNVRWLFSEPIVIEPAVVERKVLATSGGPSFSLSATQIGMTVYIVETLTTSAPALP